MELTHKEFKDRVYDFTLGKVKNIKPVVVDFYTEWCSACKIVAPALDDIRTRVGDKVDIYKVDISQADDLVHSLQIQSVPTLLFLMPGTNGPVKTVVGAYPPSQIESDIHEYLLA